jgi:hypothetical protein
VGEGAKRVTTGFDIKAGIHDTDEGTITQAMASRAGSCSMGIENGKSLPFTTPFL